MVVECLRFELARGRFDDKGATMEASACIGVKLHVGVLPVTSHMDRRHRGICVPNGMTASGTSVWTGRALQVGYDGLEIVGLAHLYSAL
jgi:hypothetical protein